MRPITQPAPWQGSVETARTQQDANYLWAMTHSCRLIGCLLGIVVRIKARIVLAMPDFERFHNVRIRIAETFKHVGVSHMKIIVAVWAN